MKSTIFIKSRLLEEPPHKEKNLPQQTQEVISFCISSNIIGLVTILDCILLSAGGSYRTAVQAPISDDWVKESLMVFMILNKLFQLSITQTQHWLTQKDQISELLHLMLFWLHFFTTKAHPKSLYPLIDEIILALGNVYHIFYLRLAAGIQSTPRWFASDYQALRCFKDYACSPFLILILITDGLYYFRR
jgi:hypothetical protein